MSVLEDVHPKLQDAKKDVCIIQENMLLLKKVLKDLINVEHFMEDSNIEYIGNTNLTELRNTIKETNSCYQANKVFYKHYSLKVAELKIKVKEYDRHQQKLHLRAMGK